MISSVSNNSVSHELLGVVTMGWSTMLADWPRTGWSSKPDWQEKLSCPENSRFKELDWIYLMTLKNQADDVRLSGTQDVIPVIISYK